MRKMKLDADALRVETFDPRPDREADVGTVFAHGTVDGCDSPTEPNTNFNEHTCDVMSCGGTCWLTPNVCGTCGDPSEGFDAC